jgi:hypothetical protein
MRIRSGCTRKFSTKAIARVAVLSFISEIGSAKSLKLQAQPGSPSGYTTPESGR